MATALPSQVFEQFKGIREFNGVSYGGQISAISCKNVELFKTDIGSCTGIRTVAGDKVFINLPEGYKVIKNFTSVQNGIKYMMIYGETETIGSLFYVDPITNEVITIVESIELGEEKERCNAITIAYGQYDVFVFTNGNKAFAYCFEWEEKKRDINAVDNQGREIKWLSMADFESHLYVASQYGVHFSHSADIFTWDDTVDGIEDSGYIDFSKRVTAVKAFSTGLFIFTETDCSHLNTTPNDTANARLQTVAMNGCFSFESIVNHDTYLFFYDDNQKGVFYIQMTDTGQTRPVGSVTKEVQSFFNNNVKTCKMYSCIYDTYNEIWILVNDKVLIYDYINQEFIERDMHNITGLCVYENRVYVCNENRILIEKMSETFDGDYIPAEYTTSIINMGSNSNLKKQKTPLLLVLNENHINSFYVEITANYKTKNPKHIRLKVANGGVWADESENPTIENNMLWDVMTWTSEDYYRKRVVEISTPQTWYTMSVRFFTKEQGDGFSIVSMEMKRLKEKTKTKGR